MDRMKKLLALLLIWLGLTFKLGYDNLKLEEWKEDDLNRRAFLVYSRTLSGCMIGSEFTNANYNFTRTYGYCVFKAYEEKDRYLAKWKK